jgi:hypothetical protein
MTSVAGNVGTLGGWYEHGLQDHTVQVALCTAAQPDLPTLNRGKLEGDGRNKGEEGKEGNK